MSSTPGEAAVLPQTPTPMDPSGEDLDLEEEEEDLEVFSKNTSLAGGGSVFSSGPSSPGSKVNQYRPEEGEAGPGVAGRDLFITIDNPESHVTAIETFIVYRVLTRTTRGDFDSSEYEVQRRFQDFLWLKGQLEEAHPTLIVHPLPEKFVVKGVVERFNEDFIETRRRALQNFLSKTACHPLLSRSPQLKVFLTVQDLAAARSQGPGLLRRLGVSLRAAAIALRGLRARPGEFAAMQDYAEDFSSKMESLDRVTQRVIREQQEYLGELRRYGPLYAQWAQLEAGLSGPLRGVASCLQRCGQEAEGQLRQLTEELEPALHQYLLCADTLKTVLKRRDHIQAEFEAKSEALTAAAAAAASKKVDLNTLKEEASALEQRLEEANRALKGDWTCWGVAMRADLREALVSTAGHNLEYHEKCLAVWETFLLSQRTPCCQDDGPPPPTT